MGEEHRPCAQRELFSRRRKLIHGCFDGAFKVNAARAFDKNDVAGTQILRQPLTGSFGVTKKHCGDSAGTGGRS